MGEIEKILFAGHLQASDLSIELNEPVTQNGERTVHIQTADFRLEMTESDYRRFAATVIDGSTALKASKKIHS